MTNLILISRENPHGQISFEANYRLLHILQPLCDKLSFMPIGYTVDLTLIDKEIDVISVPSEREALSYLLAHDFTYLIYYSGAIKLSIMTIILKLLRSHNKIIIRMDGRGSVNSSSYKHWIHRIIEKPLFSLVDIIAYQYRGFALENKMGKWADKMMLANQYINLDKFYITTLWHQRSYDLGFVGRLETEKGVNTFVAAVHYMKQFLNRPVKVLIVGTGKWHRYLQGYSRKEGLDISFTGKISATQIPEVMNQIRYLVLPTKREGVPKVVIEAMSCGTIPITTNVGGLKYLVKDKVTGFIIQPETIPMSKGIIKAMDTPNIAEIIKNGRAVVNDFSLTTTRNRYKTIIDRLGV